MLSIGVINKDTINFEIGGKGRGLFSISYYQARSQDLEKGGAILKEWEVCKRPWLEFSLILNQFQTVCPKLEAKCLGRLGNSKLFFRPKLGDLQKKKKKKKKGLRQSWEWFFGRIRPKLGDLQKKKKKKVFAKVESDILAEIRNSKLFSAQN